MIYYRRSHVICMKLTNVRLHTFLYNRNTHTYQGLVKYDRTQQQTCLCAVRTKAGTFAELCALLTGRVDQSASRLPTVRMAELMSGKDTCFFLFHIEVTFRELSPKPTCTVQIINNNTMLLTLYATLYFHNFHYY